MKSILDSKSIELTCPQCSKKFNETIGKLKTNPAVTCSACGTSISVNASELRSSMKKIDDALANLGKSLGRLGKSR